MAERPETQQQETRLPLLASRVARLQAFQQGITPNPVIKLIYFPGKEAVDGSPKEAFPEAKVIFAHPDEKFVEYVKSAGLDVHKANPDELKLDQAVDLVLFISPELGTNTPLKQLKVGGFVISAGSQRNSVKADPDLEFVGVVKFDKESKSFKLDTSDREDCWKTVENDDEFKKAEFSSTNVCYEAAARIVREVTGKTENVLQEYKSIRAKVEEELKKQLDALPADDPRKKIDLSEIELPPIEINGRQISLLPLPKKKGTPDDFFVFRRAKKEK